MNASAVWPDGRHSVGRPRRGAALCGRSNPGFRRSSPSCARRRGVRQRCWRDAHRHSGRGSRRKELQLLQFRV